MYGGDLSRKRVMSAGLKPVLKRPWQHHVIIVCYIAAPFVNIALLRAFLNASFATIFSNLVAGYGILATIWLFSAPIVGIALYFVKRFAWYLFLCHSALILLDFIVKWATRPAYYLRTVPGLHNIILLGGNLALIVVVAYILQRDFRAPYFQILNRSWRERSRIPIYHKVAIDGQSRVMSDLSTGGCFVLEPDSERTPGVIVELSFTGHTLSIECMGEVMRVTGDGLGIRFVRLPAAKRRDIRWMLKNRFSLRQKVDIPCTWVFQGEESQSRMLDVSRAGCYVQAQLAGVKVGSEAALKVTLSRAGPLYSLSGRVAWMNQGGAYERPAGFGFRFDSRQPRFMKKATACYGLGMLVR
jgi:Tfp pilus assembly protein PilZ